MKKIFSLSLFAIMLGTTFLRGQTDRMSNTVILDANGERNLRIETIEVEEQTFARELFALGRIQEIPARRSVLSSRVAGRVIKVHRYEGDEVKKDDPLLTLESRLPGNPPPLVLKAMQDGVIVASNVTLGAPVEPEDVLLEIVDHSALWAVARVPEVEAGQLNLGMKARLQIPAAGGQEHLATLTRFGVQAEPASGTVEAIFSLENPEAKIRPGMRVEFSILQEERTGVMAIPAQALQGTPSQRVVFVRDFDLPHAFVRVPVVIGEQNSQYVEIVSGLFPGDEVVTEGAYMLSFAGKGSGMSLKEALDAAHGHEHNEDGSEITPEQKAASASHGHDHSDEHDHDHDHDDHHGHSFWLWACIALAFLCLFLMQQLWKKSAAQ